MTSIGIVTSEEKTFETVDGVKNCNDLEKCQKMTFTFSNIISTSGYKINYTHIPNFIY